MRRITWGHVVEQAHFLGQNAQTYATQLNQVPVAAVAAATAAPAASVL